MKTKILTLLAASCLTFFSACSDDSSGGSKTLAEKCEALTEECLVGTWTLKTISQKSNLDYTIVDFSSAQGGTLEFTKDGIYHYVRSSKSECPGSLTGGTDDKGTWSIKDDKNLDFFQNKQGDCVEFQKHHLTTPSIEVIGEKVVLRLNTVLFQQAERDGMYEGDETEVFERTE